jgi:hypothetical protein
MMHWFTRRKPVAQVVPKPKGLARFDDADRAELDALPRRLRKKIIADRKRRVTAALERFVASKEPR